MLSQDSSTITPLAKRAIAITLLIFLLLFPHYSTYVNGHQPYINNWYSYLFILLHFIAQQSLGIVHEAGHGVCYILSCPTFITVSMGTIFQWLFPFWVFWYMKKSKEIFGAFVALYFLGFSMHYSSWYISTAHEGSIVPASKSFLGVDGYHDFNFILSRVGLLNFDWLIAGIVSFLAYIIMIASIFFLFLEAFKRVD